MRAVRSKRRQTHANVAETLRQRIASGVWPPGHMLPGRRALTKELGAALTTVERAVATLIAEGLLRADDRRGTFVTTATSTAPEPPTTPTGPGLDLTVALIGHVIPYESEAMRREQWPARILAGCEYALAGVRSLRQHFVSRVGPDGERAIGELAAELTDRIDALVVVGGRNDDVPDLLALGVPVVRVLLDPGDGRLPEVCVDGRSGGALAFRHLRESGYGHIHFLLPFATDWCLARRDGALAEASPTSLHVIEGDDLSLRGERMPMSLQRELAAPVIESLLDAGLEAGAGVIVPNDSIGETFITAAGLRGLRPGVDYGIVGFDDTRRELGLSSLRPPLEELGTAAAELLLRLLRGETCPTRIDLAHRLVPRQSTRPYALKQAG